MFVAAGYGANSSTAIATTQRGGRLVHRVTSEKDDHAATQFWFTDFAQVDAYADSSTELDSSLALQEWAQRIQTWHHQHLQALAAGQPSHGRKSRYKRPATPNISVPLPLLKFGPFGADNSSGNDGAGPLGGAKKQKRQMPSASDGNIRYGFSEADANALQYLWERHEGHQKQAALSLLVDWTRKHAIRTVRQKKHHARKRKRKHGGTWRDTLLESMPVYLSGDLQLKTTDETTASNQLLNNNNTESDDLPGTWEGVLACARAMVDSQSSQRLSSVAHFLHQVVQLQPLERHHQPSDIESTLQQLVDVYLLARRYQNKLLDLWGQNGVDVEVILKQIAAAEKEVSLSLDEMVEMKRQVSVVLEWQNRLERTVYSRFSMNASTADDGNYIGIDDADDNQNDLVSCEAMLCEGRCHGFRGKELLGLEEKVDRAYALRDRILQWKQASSNFNGSLKLESTKFVFSIVRDIQRLKMRFPEATEMLLFNADAESWIERANIAIRSRISLDEIQALIIRGEEMPLDLSEYLEKLRSRRIQASEWLANFHETIPRPETPDGSLDRLELMRRIRRELDDGHYNLVHEFATDGSRIPVEVDCVKLLQVELDARVWSTKARKWLPRDEEDVENSRKGKLEDLREHLSKASLLRDRLVMPCDEKKAWVIDGESELSSIVEKADAWVDEYRWMWESFDFEGKCLSLEQLRTIVQAGDAIYANLGSGIMSKMNRMLAQAEKWQSDFAHLLVKCNIGRVASPVAQVEMTELKKAISAAADDLALDLTEVIELRKLLKKIENWLLEASVATGEKRQTRGKKVLFSVADLHELINDAASLPFETSNYVARLREQCIFIQEWQARASTELETIIVGFQYLRVAINEKYGPATEYSRDRSASDGDDDARESVVCDSLVESTSAIMKYEEEKKCSDDQCDATASTAASEQDANAFLSFGCGDCNVHSLIKSFCKDSKMSFIVTPEGATACQLEKVSRWCMRSLQYLENPGDVFDHRFFGAFDRFVSEGMSLSQEMETISGKGTLPGNALLQRLRTECRRLITDQVERLQVLLRDRKDYVAWCKKAEQLLDTEERRPTIEKIVILTEQSRLFPSKSDLVKKVRKLAKEASSWSELASKALAADKKMSMHYGKSLLDQGDKLGFTCAELKILRNGLKSARGWSTRVRRCKVGQGTAQHSNLVALLEEHGSLIFDMSDEVAELSQGMKNYCLCRRPYEGFMIGCDSCEDWFHGPCVGVTESHADKVTKYVCLRCTVKKTYTASAFALVGIIRKWSGEKDRKQARQLENQKFTRKVRKENREVEKLQQQASDLRNMLACAESTEAIYQTESNGERKASNAQDGVVRTAIDVLPVHAQKGSVSELETSPILQGDTNDSVPKQAAQQTDTRAEFKEKPSSKESNESLSSGIVKFGGLVLSRTEVKANLEVIARLIQGCASRLKKIAEEEKEQKRLQDFEDKKSELLKHWIIRVRSLVVVPSTSKLGAESMPNRDGSISDAMKAALCEAEKLGLNSFADVKEVNNHFRCMGWCLRAIAILARQPTADELVSLVKASELINYPDEKAVRTIKSMAKRVTVWQNKVTKALSPIPGETQPYSIHLLKELASAGDDIPVCMPLEVRLRSVIEDGGCRYCLCGGPSDGLFMVGCEHCDGWYHGHCVGVCRQTPEKLLDGWKCPKCVGPMDPMAIALQVDRFHENFESEAADDGDSVDTEDISSNAPDPDEMWPPFGLFGSQKAAEVLGEECRAIPDIVGPLAILSSPEALASVVVNEAAEKIGKTSSKPVATYTVSSKHDNANSTAAIRSSTDAYHTASRLEQTNAGAISTETFVAVEGRGCAVHVHISESPPKFLASASFPVVPPEVIPKRSDAEPIFADRDCMSCKHAFPPTNAEARPKVQAPATSSFVRQRKHVSKIDASLTAHHPRFPGTYDGTSTNSSTICACPAAFQAFHDIGVLASETTKPVVNEPMDLS